MPLDPRPANNLDPHPANELGRGILDPAVEAQLLADGVVFAMQVRHGDGHVSLALFHRPAVETLAAAKEHGAKLLVALHKEEMRQPIAAG